MADEPISSRVRVRRIPEQGHYERATIEAALDHGLMAHVAFADGDQPYCIPMLYTRSGPVVYIHGSTGSRAMRTLARGVPACLTVTRLDGIVLARSVFEHSANYESVVVLGRFRPVEDPAERLAAFEAFTEKLLPGRWAEARRPSRKELSATVILALRNRGSVGQGALRRPGRRRFARRRARRLGRRHPASSRPTGRPSRRRACGRHRVPDSVTRLTSGRRVTQVRRRGARSGDVAWHRGPGGDQGHGAVTAAIRAAAATNGSGPPPDSSWAGPNAAPPSGAPASVVAAV